MGQMPTPTTTRGTASVPLHTLQLPGTLEYYTVTEHTLHSETEQRASLPHLHHLRWVARLRLRAAVAAAGAAHVRAGATMGVEPHEV